MALDRSTIQSMVQHYFDGLYEADAAKLGEVFHPSADLRWLEKGELQVLSVPDWLDRVGKRQSGKAQGLAREDFIVTVDRSDETPPSPRSAANCRRAISPTIWWR